MLHRKRRDMKCCFELQERLVERFLCAVLQGSFVSLFVCVCCKSDCVPSVAEGNGPICRVVFRKEGFVVLRVQTNRLVLRDEVLCCVDIELQG